jgi:hypothetical protein
MYLDTKVDPRETKNETMSMNMEDNGGCSGGNDCKIVNEVLIKLTKKLARFSRKNIIRSITDDY